MALLAWERQPVVEAGSDPPDHLHHPTLGRVALEPVILERCLEELAHLGRWVA